MTRPYTGRDGSEATTSLALARASLGLIPIGALAATFFKDILSNRQAKEPGISWSSRHQRATLYDSFPIFILKTAPIIQGYYEKISPIVAHDNFRLFLFNHTCPVES